MATLTSPTLTELLAEVRILLNQTTAANSNWTDAALTNWLNEGVRRYFQEVTMHAEGHFTTTTTLDITAEQETVALPTDFYELKTLHKKVTNGWVSLNYNNPLEEGFSTKGGTSSNTYIPYYFFRGQELVLRPTPNFSETGGLLLEYIQFPDTMVNGGDTLTNQVSPIFRDLIIMFAVYKAKFQESQATGISNHQNAAGELGALVTQLQDAVALRSKAPQYIKAFNPESEGV